MEPSGHRRTTSGGAATRPGWSLTAPLEALGWALLGLALALVLVTVRRAGGEVWSNIFNVLHVLLSASIALVSLRLSRKLLAGWLTRPWLHYVWAGVVVFVLGGGLEVAQFFAPGLPSVFDLVIDLAGGAAALGFVFGRSLRHRPALRWAIEAGSLGLFVCALASPCAALWQATVRARIFPVLCSFSDSELRYVGLNDGAELTTLERAEGLAPEWRVGLTFPADRDYPGLELAAPAGDWSRSQELVIPLYSTDLRPFRLLLRVHDEAHTGDFDDRFNIELTVESGRNEFRIPIPHIASGPRLRDLNLANVEALVLFAPRPSQEHHVLLGTWRLEGASGG